MPLYEYRCALGHGTTALRRMDDRHLELACGRCGAPAALGVSAPAKTAWRWGDTKWDGRYDRGLGVQLRDERHRKAVMQQRGLRELEDGEVEAEVRRVSLEQEAHESRVATFTRTLRETGDASFAAAETFPAHEILED